MATDCGIRYIPGRCSGTRWGCPAGGGEGLSCTKQFADDQAGVVVEALDRHEIVRVIYGERRRPGPNSGEQAAFNKQAKKEE